jgi:dephospho-CoA kinase
MLRIGLTGGIGSGKSTVAALLTQRGATLIDTDAIARHLTEPGGAALGAIAAEFGHDAIGPSGALDRDHMRQVVFADASAKRRLEAILHPLIGAETLRQTQAVQGDGAAPALVYDVPLLAESPHWRGRVDRVLVVDCPESTQIERVGVRSGLKPDAVLAIIAQQANRAQRRAIADAVIHNDAISVDELDRHVAVLWQLWVHEPIARVPPREGD